MTLSKPQAVSMLVALFEANKLTFRSMAVLKEVFDEAVQAVNEERSENLADYHMGRSPKPEVFDKDIEDEFYSDIAQKACQTVGLGDLSQRALDAVADFAIREAEYTTKDML